MKKMSEKFDKIIQEIKDLTHIETCDDDALLMRILVDVLIIREKNERAIELFAELVALNMEDEKK